MPEDIPFVGITKKTPVNEAIKYGKCEKGRDCHECSTLCTYGSGALAEEDFKKIAKHLGKTVAKLKMNYLEKVDKLGTTRWRPKLIRKKGAPYGRCIFYNEQEKCTIHGVKPLECKISTCTEYGPALTEWFTLNYYLNESNPHSIREWAIKLKTHPTIPGGELHELIEDQDTLKKIMNYEILS